MDQEGIRDSLLLKDYFKLADQTRPVIAESQGFEPWEWIDSLLSIGSQSMFQLRLFHPGRKLMKTGPGLEWMYQVHYYGYINSAIGEHLSPFDEEGPVDGIQSGGVPGGNDV
jgi:hypothetical protein